MGRWWVGHAWAWVWPPVAVGPVAVHTATTAATACNGPWVGVWVVGNATAPVLTVVVVVVLVRAVADGDIVIVFLLLLIAVRSWRGCIVAFVVTWLLLPCIRCGGAVSILVRVDSVAIVLRELLSGGCVLLPVMVMVRVCGGMGEPGHA